MECEIDLIWRELAMEESSGLEASGSGLDLSRETAEVIADRRAVDGSVDVSLPEASVF
jgi:hypothetical protein